MFEGNNACAIRELSVGVIAEHFVRDLKKKSKNLAFYLEDAANYRYDIRKARAKVKVFDQKRMETKGKLQKVEFKVARLRQE